MVEQQECQVSLAAALEALQITDQGRKLIDDSVSIREEILLLRKSELKSAQERLMEAQKGAQVFRKKAILATLAGTGLMNSIFITHFVAIV